MPVLVKYGVRNAVKERRAERERVVEGEPVPERLPLGEHDRLRVALTVGVCVLHTVPLSVLTALKVKDMVAVGLSEGDTETLPEAVPPAGELEGEAVPRGPSAAAPPLALRLPVPNPLAEKEGRRVGDADAESVALAHEERETLAVELCESDRVPSRLPEGLALTLLLRATETVEVAVPW